MCLRLSRISGKHGGMQHLNDLFHPVSVLLLVHTRIWEYELLFWRSRNLWWLISSTCGCHMKLYNYYGLPNILWLIIMPALYNYMLRGNGESWTRRIWDPFITLISALNLINYGLLYSILNGKLHLLPLLNIPLLIICITNLTIYGVTKFLALINYNPF